MPAAQSCLLPVVRDRLTAPVDSRADPYWSIILDEVISSWLTEHAGYLHQRGADYVFTVKEDQHRLHGLLDALPWHEIPAHITSGSGHGRSERRSIQLAPLGEFIGCPAIDFPHATHAFLIERYPIHHTSSN